MVLFYLSAFLFLEVSVGGRDTYLLKRFQLQEALFNEIKYALKAIF